MFGLMPVLADPKISFGKVSTPPHLTKLMIMKSSSEIVKAMRNPEMIPGIIKGQRDQTKRLGPGYISIFAPIVHKHPRSISAQSKFSGLFPKNNNGRGIGFHHLPTTGVSLHVCLGASLNRT
ncbi:MAG: hypothetical protein GY945_12935 [Rhodobacteraceae bacterium]|nr:hypothetical protein [Paracoccaceae bacterium]